MGGAQDVFGQLWKEYALSDSRYLTSDTLVLCMETITVVSWALMHLRDDYSDRTVPLGPIMFRSGVYGLQSSFPAPSTADNCLYVPSLRMYLILRDQSLR